MKKFVYLLSVVCCLFIACKDGPVIEEPEVEEPVTYTCSNCNTVYGTQEEMNLCSVEEGCPKWFCKCDNCHTQYFTSAEKEKCAVKEGCPKWVCECSNCHTTYATTEDIENCSVKSGCPKYVTYCSNCGSEYSTDEECILCSSEEGCPKSVKEIRITKNVQKVSYYENDESDFSDLEITAYYYDETSNKVTDYTITGFDSTSAGEKTITVTYNTKTVSFNVSITALELVKIEISNPIDEYEYYVNEELDTTGLEITATYNSGNSEVITDYTLTGFSSTTLNSTSIVTVSYTYRGVTKTTSFETKTIEPRTYFLSYDFTTEYRRTVPEKMSRTIQNSSNVKRNFVFKDTYKQWDITVIIHRDDIYLNTNCTEAPLMDNGKAIEFDNAEIIVTDNVTGEVKFYFDNAQYRYSRSDNKYPYLRIAVPGVNPYDPDNPIIHNSSICYFDFNLGVCYTTNIDYNSPLFLGLDYYLGRN